MEEENGLAYQILIIVIIIIIAIAGVLINKLVGKNGVIDRVAKVEIDYTKEDILEKINYKVTQKFIEINNQAKESGKTIAELYNSDVVIEFLKQNLIIEENQDENGDYKPGIYKINVEKLSEQGQGIHHQGFFQLEKIDDKYMIIHYEENGKAKEVGELKIQQTN